MTNSEFQIANRAKWRSILQKEYGAAVPASATWTDVDQTVRVLTPFAQPELGHMFFPLPGGGMDFDRVAKSREPGCIELLCDEVPQIIKPKSLRLETFPHYLSMSYFRIELDSLAPSGVYESSDCDYEELVEMPSGRYINRSAWDEGYYSHNGEETRLPKSARLVVRRFSGVFVIFAKGSRYNLIGDTYNARHAKVPAGEFRAHVEQIIEVALQEGVRDEV